MSAALFADGAVLPLFVFEGAVAVAACAAVVGVVLGGMWLAQRLHRIGSEPADTGDDADRYAS